jgi:hypothetical protein
MLRSFFNKIKNKFKQRALKDARSLYKPHVFKRRQINYANSVKTMDDLLNAIIQTRTEVIHRSLYDIYLVLKTPLTKPKTQQRLDWMFKYNAQDKDKNYIYSHEEIRHTGKTFKETVVDTGVLASFFGQFGEFNLPQSILDRIIDVREKNQIPDNVLDSIPKSRFEQAKEIFELLKTNTQLNEYALYAIMGALFVECAWDFDGRVVNNDELNGKEGDAGFVAGTGGESGCGECWFGLTFWPTKLAIINDIKPPGVSNDQSTYGKNGTKMLADLDKSWQCKIMNSYFKNIAKKQYEVLSKTFSDISSLADDEMEEQLAASYLWKAGQGMDPTLENAEEIAERYIKTHTAQGHTNIKNGFYTQIFISIAFALYLEEDKVYKSKEIDELL